MAWLVTNGPRIACLAGLLIGGCSTTSEPPCALTMTDQQVIAIADAFLAKKIKPEFRAVAERRLTRIDCQYYYEEAEKLDSFGIGYEVIIDRKGRIVDFRSTE